MPGNYIFIMIKYWGFNEKGSLSYLCALGIDRKYPLNECTLQEPFTWNQLLHRSIIYLWFTMLSSLYLQNYPIYMKSFLAWFFDCWLMSPAVSASLRLRSSSLWLRPTSLCLRSKSLLLRPSSLLLRSNSLLLRSTSFLLSSENFGSFWCKSILLTSLLTSPAMPDLKQCEIVILKK